MCEHRPRLISLLSLSSSLWFGENDSQMWWQQLHASEGWCGVKEVAVEGRLARCQPPIGVFWDGTAPVHRGHLMAYPACCGPT